MPASATLHANIFVMGELLRRGFDAQLADRNTEGYDVLAGSAEKASLRKVQVKTVRARPWYVKTADFKGERLDPNPSIAALGAGEICPRAVKAAFGRRRGGAGEDSWIVAGCRESRPAL